MAQRPPRLHTLDAIRGVAALLVAVHHKEQRAGGLDFTGYFAVDLFFVISGFVIALNYGGRLAQGLPPLRFIGMRLLRLAPLYALGTCLGLVKQAAGVVLNDPRTMSLPILACTAGAALAMVPSPCTALLYPLDTPFWSLFFELLVNAAFAVSLWRWPSRILAIVAVASAGVLLLQVHPPLYFNVGWDWAGLGAGAPRATFSFLAGVLICRHANVTTRRTSWAALIPVLAVVALILLPTTFTQEIAIESIVIFAAFPAVVALAVRVTPPAAATAAFALLGDLSYPLYAIHMPLLALWRTFGLDGALPGDGALVPFVAILIALAYLAGKADARLRKRISARLGLRATAVPQAI